MFIFPPIDYYCSTFFFFSNDTPTTVIYTLSLHDALPISLVCAFVGFVEFAVKDLLWNQVVIRSNDFHVYFRVNSLFWEDRKSTRLNSSHVEISYAVFCLKKKKKLHIN